MEIEEYSWIVWHDPRIVCCAPYVGDVTVFVDVAALLVRIVCFREELLALSSLLMAPNAVGSRLMIFAFVVKHVFWHEICEFRELVLCKTEALHDLVFIRCRR